MTHIEQFGIPLIIGLILDSIFGDPYKMPHPIKLFGIIISFCDKKLNFGSFKIVKGLLVSISLITFTWTSFDWIQTQISSTEWIYYPVASIMVFFGLANRNLIDEALRVEKKLSKEGLDAGRKQLSFIVGRDTTNLSENQIRTAVLETLSENLSDGVVAPLFYYALGGFPLMLTYKMINTLDSMIGYKNDKYFQFGKFAARIDDIANLIPSRITALIMTLVTLNFQGLKFIFLFGHQHASPNSGYPESALAGILDCRLGGPNTYNGILISKPYIGMNERQIIKVDIIKTCIINTTVCITTCLIILITMYYR